MKKTLSKIPGIKKREAPQSRMTSDTISEHREHILAEGRRFKYPVQYAKHRLVINAVIISVVAIVLFGVFIWSQLYVTQSSNDFIYRTSKVLSLPVAKIDGQPVKYGDYLMRYRSAIQYLSERDQINLSSEDGKKQAEAIKRRDLDVVMAEAYAAKLAKEQKIVVDDVELEEFLLQQRKAAGNDVSESAYNSVIASYYGWSPEEYRHVMRSQLLRQKVAYAVDDTARGNVLQVEAAIEGKKALKDIADLLGDRVAYTAPMWVPKNNNDGGLTKLAASLSKGQTSKVEKISRGVGEVGYYVVTLVDQKDDQVQYEFLFIPLTEFDKKLAEALKSSKTKEYITVKQSGDGF